PKPREAAFVDIGADHLGQLALASRRRVERRLPVPERALAVGHPFELNRGNVPAKRHRRVEDAVRGDVIAVREGEKLLSDAIAVAQRESANAAGLIAALAALDLGLGDDGVPRAVTVEVA